MSNDFYKKSIFYKITLQEGEEIDKLKWNESQEQGYDIGKNKAILIWVRYHKLEWLSSVYTSLSCF